MKITNLNKKFLLIITFILFFSVITLMTSCQDVFKSQEDLQKTATATFLGEANKISNDFSFTINDFQTCIKNNDVDTMTDKLSESQKLIEEFNKIETPDNCKEIKQMYSDAFSQLQKILIDYTTIFKDLKDNKQDTQSIQQRIVALQEPYNKAIESLKKADEEVNKLQQ